MLPDNILDQIKRQSQTASKKELLGDVLTLLAHGYYANKTIQARDYQRLKAIAQLVGFCFERATKEEMDTILAMRGYVPIDKKEGDVV